MVGTLIAVGFAGAVIVFLNELRKMFLPRGLVAVDARWQSSWLRRALHPLLARPAPSAHRVTPFAAPRQLEPPEVDRSRPGELVRPEAYAEAPPLPGDDPRDTLKRVKIVWPDAEALRDTSRRFA